MKTLLLDKLYKPIAFLPLKKMSRLVMTHKAEIIAEWPGMFLYKGINYPAIIRLDGPEAYIRKRPLVPRFNFNGIFRRDRYRCFPDSVRVLMSNGREKPISQVSEGDSIIDAYGQHQTVIAKGNKEVDKLLSVKFKGSAEKLLVTPDHPFLSTNMTFEEISTVKYGLLPRNISYVLNNKIICTYDFLPKNKTYKIHNGEIKSINKSKKPGIPLFIQHSAELAYLLGLYVAEGSFSGHSACFSFSIDEVDTLAEDVVKCVKYVFGIKAIKRIYPKSNTCIVTISSVLVGEFLKCLCGHKCYNKKTPWDGIGEFVKEYIRGVFYGDGYIKREKYKITLGMTSKHIIYDIRVLLWGIGIYPGIYEINKIQKKPVWLLVLQGENYANFSNIILDEICGQRKKIFGNNTHIFMMIKDKQEIVKKTTVYNIEVSGSNTYIANGVAVHNCQYTGVALPKSQLTVDHILPKSRGGKSSWENCVTASLTVNANKGNRTPEEASLKLLTKPIAPKDPLALIYANIPNPHPDWQSYFPGIINSVGDVSQELERIAS